MMRLLRAASSYQLNHFDRQDNLLDQTCCKSGVVSIVMTDRNNEKGQIVEQTREYKEGPDSTPQVYHFACNDPDLTSEALKINHDHET